MVAKRAKAARAMDKALRHINPDSGYPLKETEMVSKVFGIVLICLLSVGCSSGLGDNFANDFKDGCRGDISSQLEVSTGLFGSLKIIVYCSQN